MWWLEEWVGCLIFIKDGCYLWLIEEGLWFVEFVCWMIQLNDEMLFVFNGKKDIGYVKFGVFDDYVDCFLLQVLVVFNWFNLFIEVLVECVFSVWFIDLICEGVLDVVIMIFGDIQELCGEIIRWEQLYWVMLLEYLVYIQEIVCLVFGLVLCGWWWLVMEVLDWIGCWYWVFYISGSVLVLVGVVQVGLVVMVILESVICEGMWFLDEWDGFLVFFFCDIVFLRFDIVCEFMYDILCNYLIVVIGNVGMIFFQVVVE